MFVPYEILRNMQPAGLTVVQQREADDQLGRIAAGLMRRGRPGGRTVCGGSGAGSGSRPRGWFSKISRTGASPAGRVVRPAA
jgi:hypothetical protein